MKKSIFYYILGIALIAGFAFILVKNKKQNDTNISISDINMDDVAVRVAEVAYDQQDNGYISNGIFAPYKELKLSSEIGGRIVDVLVDEGDEVTKGQTLATIKRDIVNVDVKSAQANYQTALEDFNRYSRAYESGGVTKQQLSHAELQLKSAKSMLDQANIMLGNTNIRSNITGVIDKTLTTPGAVVGAGTPLFYIVDVSKLKLQLSVSERNIINLKPNDTVKIKAGVYPDKNFKGKITFIAPKADASLNFRVEMEVLDDDDNDLKAGMYGTAILDNVKNKSENLEQLLVPRQAFVNGISNEQVFVIEDNIAKLTKVTIGRAYKDYVEILNGLEEGETVVISGQINLTDGKKVRIVE